MVRFLILQIIIVSLIILTFITSSRSVYSEPIINDPSLNVQIIAKDFSKPTGMVFLDNKIIVIEKGGDVKLFSEDIKQESTLLQFDVNTKSERGLLGVEANGNDVFFFILLMQVLIQLKIEFLSTCGMEMSYLTPS